jgi:NTE family protein
VPWGVALSGGGVPGIAGHLGFVAAMAEANIVPDVVVGASAGGVVAGMLGAGVPVGTALERWAQVGHDELLTLLLEVDHLLHVLRPSPAPGLLSLEVVFRSVLRGAARARSTVDWSPGHGVVCADLTAGRPVVLHRDGAVVLPTVSALCATAAFPGLFSGVRTPGEDHLYVDGGLFADVPVSAARDLGASRVVAVRIGVPATVPEVLSVEELLRITLDRLLLATERGAADVTVVVPVGGGLLNYTGFAQDVQAGRDAFAAHRERIAALAAT